jgi:hypothetical protein
LRRYVAWLSTNAPRQRRCHLRQPTDLLRELKGKGRPSPRSAVGLSLAAPIAFNVQGVRLAVHRVTGEIRVLPACMRPISVADQPDAVPRPADGAVAMGYG